MENIVAHSLEKLYREFEKADQIYLDSGMKDMDAYEKGLAEAARRAAAEHMEALYNSMDQMLCSDIVRDAKYTIQRHDTRQLLTATDRSDSLIPCFSTGRMAAIIISWMNGWAWMPTRDSAVLLRLKCLQRQREAVTAGLQRC